MRSEESDVISLVVNSKQAMAEIPQKTCLIPVKSELKPRNDNFVFQ